MKIERFNEGEKNSKVEIIKIKKSESTDSVLVFFEIFLKKHKVNFGKCDRVEQIRRVFLSVAIIFYNHIENLQMSISDENSELSQEIKRLNSLLDSFILAIELYKIRNQKDGVINYFENIITFDEVKKGSIFLKNGVLHVSHLIDLIGVFVERENDHVI
jgi:hypothetical protein